MKIGVIGGTGAMGSAMGSLLFDAGNDVTLVNISRAHVDAINADGLTIEEKSGERRQVRVLATTDPGSVGPVDLAILFVKCYHTEAAIRSAMLITDDHTTVLSLQNGWGNAPRLQD